MFIHSILLYNILCKSSLQIGIVHHPAIHAMVGGDPYNPKSKEVTTSADLHLVQEHSLVILQIRSPLIKVCQDACVCLSFPIIITLTMIYQLMILMRRYMFYIMIVTWYKH